MDLLLSSATRPGRSSPTGAPEGGLGPCRRRPAPEQLRVLVGSLRRNEPEPANPRYVVTLPWVGYRFVAPLDPDDPDRPTRQMDPVLDEAPDPAGLVVRAVAQGPAGGVLRRVGVADSRFFGRLTCLRSSRAVDARSKVTARRGRRSGPRPARRRRQGDHRPGAVPRQGRRQHAVRRAVRGRRQGARRHRRRIARPQIRVFKKRRRKTMRVSRGHRSTLTKVEIKGIEF